MKEEQTIINLAIIIMDLFQNNCRGALTIHDFIKCMNASQWNKYNKKILSYLIEDKKLVSVDSKGRFFTLTNEGIDYLEENYPQTEIIENIALRIMRYFDENARSPIRFQQLPNFFQGNEWNAYRIEVFEYLDGKDWITETSEGKFIILTETGNSFLDSWN